MTKENLYEGVNMNIFTDCQLWPVKKVGSNVLATGNFTIVDTLKISVMLVKSKDGSVFVSLPSHNDPKTGKWYNDVVPVMYYLEEGPQRTVDSSMPNTQAAVNHYVLNYWNKQNNAKRDEQIEFPPADDGDQTVDTAATDTEIDESW